MFWGLIMEPNKRYTQIVEKAFHVSMATLDVTTTTVEEVVQVMLGYDNRNYLLCNLKKGSQLQVPLDLNFKEGTKIAFTSNGHGHVHLTGYLLPEDDLDDFDDMEDEEGEEEEEEEEEQVPQLVGNQSKRKAQASPTDAKSTKRLKAQAPTTDDSEEESSDDDDENVQEDSDADADESLEVEAEDSDEEEVEEEESDDDDDEEEEVVEEVKPQKKNKQKQEQQQQQSKQQQKKQKEQKQNNSLTNGKDVKTKQITKEQSPNNSQVQKKKFSINGVQIEDLKVGNGEIAKPGKTVAVYYTGRLKTGKVFDSTRKGNGFKFRLGKGEVIKGWDIGVSGMKVGGKRTLTIPPNLAYGQKGSPPVIPGNSTLTFEVELKEVH